MFTGIIECMGEILETVSSGSNRSFRIRSEISSLLKPDQSLAHDGVCLTIEHVEGDAHQVTAIQETLQKTTLEAWKPGYQVNLERSMIMGGRVDGHLVQGHVDARGVCTEVLDQNGSHLCSFSFPDKFAPLVIEKGSICINGISLTAFHVTSNSLQVAIIPYTWEHTNIGRLSAGQSVNLEFDMLGKYVSRYREIFSGQNP